MFYFLALLASFCVTYEYLSNVDQLTLIPKDIDG